MVSKLKRYCSRFSLNLSYPFIFYFLSFIFYIILCVKLLSNELLIFYSNSNHLLVSYNEDLVVAIFSWSPLIIIMIFDLQVKVSALQCLVKIMSLYYQYMEAYMGQVRENTFSINLTLR